MCASRSQRKQDYAGNPSCYIQVIRFLTFHVRLGQAVNGGRCQAKVSSNIFYVNIHCSSKAAGKENMKRKCLSAGYKDMQGVWGSAPVILDIDSTCT
jgi:hypothetical protein